MKISKIIYKITLLAILMLISMSCTHNVQAIEIAEYEAGGGGAGSYDGEGGVLTPSDVGTGTGLPSLDLYRPTVSAGGATAVIGRILGILMTLGAIMITVSIAIIGFNSILGSASEKAEYQQKLMGVVFAGIFMVASSAIAKMIMNVATSL